MPASLAQFAWVYEGMGALGWPHSEVDEMEVWEVARFLGVGGTGPVAAGSRGIVLPSDRDDTPDARRPSGPGAGPGGRLGGPVPPAGEFVGHNVLPAVAPPRTETRSGPFADSRLAARMAEHEARQRAAREAAATDEG